MKYNDTCVALIIQLIQSRNSRKGWTDISPIYNVFPKMDKNQTNLLLISNNNLIYHVTHGLTCMKFKAVNQLNPIGAMKSFSKPNYNICIQEHLTVLKKLCNKRVTLMKNNQYIYRAFWHKKAFHVFFLNTDDPVKDTPPQLEKIGLV